MNRKVLAGLLLALLAAAPLVWRMHPMSRTADAQESDVPEGMKAAIFAGGCFWCMVHPFDQLKGVTKVVSGYTGGTVAHPTYKQVSEGNTGHVEAVRILYDPQEISYETLLDVFWRNVDPLDIDGQFCDRGSSYRSEIFVTDSEQRKAAEASKAAIEKRLGQAVVTQIVKAGPFWPADEYHQDFYKKNPLRYRFYRSGCGRDTRLEALWGTQYPGHD
jgi:peptide-methionine (S)-S-oxide reductase